MWGGILGISPDHLHLQIPAEEPRWPPPSIRTEYLFSRVEVVFGKLLVFPWHYMRSRCKASVCLWWFDQLYLIDIPASDWPECWPRLSNAPLFCLTRLTLLRHNTSILSQSEEISETTITPDKRRLTNNAHRWSLLPRSAGETFLLLTEIFYFRNI